MTKSSNESRRLFCGKYRSPTARKKGWRYADPGCYFVTICTKERIPWFGDIRNGRMMQTAPGEIAMQCFHQIPRHYSNVKIDAFIIMPDHVHGIVIIGEPNHTPQLGPVGTPYMASLHDPIMKYMASLRGKTCAIMTRNPHHHPEWEPACLGSIIQQYKRACTHQIREMGYPDFAWQSRFHDHIIRDERSLHAIRTYIEQNPRRWKTTAHPHASFS